MLRKDIWNCMSDMQILMVTHEMGFVGYKDE